MRIALLLAFCFAGCTRDTMQPYDVILISIDTLRADRVTQKLMPTLDSLRAKSTDFSKAYSPANESLLAHAALFTGRRASDWGALNYETYRLPSSAHTLAQSFSDGGYRTSAVVGGGHVSAHFGFANGFDSFRSGTNFSGFAQTVPMAIDELRSHNDPLFLFVHGYDCHTPYIKPGPAGRSMTPGYEGPFLKLAHDPVTYERIYNKQYAPDFQPSQIFTEGGPSFLSTDIFEALPKHIETSATTIALSDEDISFLIGTYDSAALYADMWLSILFEELHDQGRWNQTIIAVISDHGEDLLDHGVFNHRAGLWDSTTHVPMMLFGPGIPPQTIETTVSTRDIGAMLLSAANIAGDFPGNDWIHDPPTEAPPVVSEGIGLTAVRR